MTEPPGPPCRNNRRGREASLVFTVTYWRMPPMTISSSWSMDCAAQTQYAEIRISDSTAFMELRPGRRYREKILDDTVEGEIGMRNLHYRKIGIYGHALKSDDKLCRSEGDRLNGRWRCRD